MLPDWRSGHVPVFVDGTGIEVDGRLFEHAARLRPGGDVACGWKGRMKRDLAPLLPPGTPVRVHCDSACYRGEFVEHVSSQGWDYPAGVTDANKCRPVLDVVEDLPAHGWTDIGMGESATWVRHRPAKWKDEQSHAVVRGTAERQGEPVPRYAMILANRDDLPLAEVVRRHRSKQGPALTGRSEDAFEGPLVDMDLHHPPCRGYRANQAFHAYGRMAHMLLRAVQYRLLPKAARRHGIRPLVRHPVRTVARLVTSGRQRSLLFASCCMRRDWLFHASLQLEGG